MSFTHDECETVRALAAMMRDMGVESLKTPGGYSLVMGASRALATSPKADKTEKEVQQGEEELLFAHLG